MSVVLPTTRRLIAWLLTTSLVAATLIFSPLTAQAQSGQTWTIRYLDADPIFTNAADFQYDADTGTYSAINAMDEFGSVTFTELRPSVVSDASAAHFVTSLADDMTGIDVVTLNFSQPLTNAGGTIEISSGVLGTCNQDCSEIMNPVAIDFGFVSTITAVSTNGHEWDTTPDRNDAGWNNTDVEVEFFWNAPDGALIDYCTISSFVDGEGTDLGYTESCLDSSATAMSVRPSLKIDQTPPETAIDATSFGTGNTSLTTEFSGSDGLSGVAGFECALDQIDYEPCTSPLVLTDVPNGDHTLRIRTVDIADNADATPEEIVWTTAFDETAPTGSATASPAANANGWHDADVTITIDWTDNAGGLGIDPDLCTTSVPVAGEGLALPYEASCTDVAGNEGSVSGQVNVDQAAPTVALTSTPSGVSETGAGSFTFAAVDALTGPTDLIVTCQLDANDPTPCDGSFDFDGLGDGEHAFVVRAMDLAGNETVASHAWTVAIPVVYTCLDITGTEAEIAALGYNLIVGTNEADELVGTTGNDVIIALGGDDKVRARRGDDIVCAGEGNDEVLLGSGNDQAIGEAGVDTISGGGGADTISGGAEADVLNGNGGADEIAGNDGDDVISGNRGNDNITGGEGNDECHLGNGNDAALLCEAVTSS